MDLTYATLLQDNQIHILMELIILFGSAIPNYSVVDSVLSHLQITQSSASCNLESAQKQPP